MIGVPGNSLLAHEGGRSVGDTVRRVITVKKDGEGRVGSLEIKYHLREPE